MASGTLNGRGEDLRFHTEGVHGHDGRHDEKTKGHQEEVRDGNQHAERGCTEAFERHDPRPFDTALLAELQHLHRSMRGRFVTGCEDLSGVLGSVLHAWFVPPD